MKFHMDSQVDLNMTKASSFDENLRNRKNHTKSYVQIVEAASIQVSSDADVNVLLSGNNYLRFGIIYPTGPFYKDNWLVNHKKLCVPSEIFEKRICCFAWRLCCRRFRQIPQHLV